MMTLPSPGRCIMTVVEPPHRPALRDSRRKQASRSRFPAQTFCYRPESKWRLADWQPEGRRAAQPEEEQWRTYS
jgi:hypothetical protein